MVFTILATKHPLSLVELLNQINQQYNKEVSFQAVRKAALQLMDARVLVKEGKKFSISKSWILELMKYGSILQKQYFAESAKGAVKVETGPNVTIFTIPRLVDMDQIWNSIMRESLDQKKNGEEPIIAFEAVHFWWVLVNLAQETELMKGITRRGIICHFNCFGNTPLDLWTSKYYNDIGVACETIPKPSDFVNGHNIGIYGDFIVQATHPPKIAKRIEDFFKKYKRVEDTKLADIMDIVSEETDICMTVIRDPLLAKNMRDTILARNKKR